jgi:hypothetical protein
MLTVTTLQDRRSSLLVKLKNLKPTTHNYQKYCPLKVKVSTATIYQLTKLSSKVFGSHLAKVPAPAAADTFQKLLRGHL